MPDSRVLRQVRLRGGTISAVGYVIALLSMPMILSCDGGVFVLLVLLAAIGGTGATFLAVRNLASLAAKGCGAAFILAGFVTTFDEGRPHSIATAILGLFVGVVIAAFGNVQLGKGFPKK